MATYGARVRLTATESPWQHGRLERFHRVFRHLLQATYRTVDEGATFSDVVEVVLEARNEMVNIRGISPYVLVFGCQPRRHLEAGEGGDESMPDDMMRSLLDQDPAFATSIARRQAAKEEWVKHLSSVGLRLAGLVLTVAVTSQVT